MFVDGELENCCGWKFYVGMMIEIFEEGIFFMVKNGNEFDDVVEWVDILVLL